MTERYGPGHGDEGHRPSGRGAVTERLARQPSGATEIDLTDGGQSGRESSDAFEPPRPAEATRPEVRPLPDEATRLLADLVGRRRQITGMIAAEKQRQKRLAAPRLQKSIARLLAAHYANSGDDR